MANYTVTNVGGKTEIYEMHEPSGGPGCLSSLISEYGFKRACYYILICAILFSSGVVGLICLPFAVVKYIKSKKDKNYKKKEGYLSPGWFLALCAITTLLLIGNISLGFLEYLFCNSSTIAVANI